MRQKPIVASVAVLFGACCPAAIVGAVRSVFVDALNRMGARRSSSHIRHEIYKRFSPSATDANSASTILAVSSLVFVVATITHPFPHTVNTGVGLAVGRVDSVKSFSVFATTTGTGAAFEIAPNNLAFNTAFTPTLPNESSIVPTASKRNDVPVIEVFAGNVLESRIGGQFQTVWGFGKSSFVLSKFNATAILAPKSKSAFAIQVLPEFVCRSSTFANGTTVFGSHVNQHHTMRIC